MYAEVKYGIGSEPSKIVSIGGPDSISIPVLKYLLMRLANSKYRFSVEFSHEVDIE